LDRSFTPIGEARWRVGWTDGKWKPAFEFKPDPFA